MARPGQPGRFLRVFAGLPGHPRVIDFYDAGMLGDGRPSRCLAGSTDGATPRTAQFGR
jgi:hypothetical protein